MNAYINDSENSNLNFVSGRCYLEHTQLPSYQDEKCAYWNVIYDHKLYNIKLNFITYDVTGEEWITDKKTKEITRLEIPRHLAKTIMKEKFLIY